MTTTISVTSRVKSSHLLAAWLFVFTMGAVMLVGMYMPAVAPKNPATGVRVWIYLVGLTALCLGFGRTRVVADETGLTWTGFFLTRHADWGQVRGVRYEERMGNKIPVVETEVGSFRLPLSMTNREEMCRAIGERVGT